MYKVFAGFLAFCALVIFFGSWAIVGPGEQGIKVTLGKVSQTTLSNGFHFKLPLFTSIRKISVARQTDSDKLAAASKDLQDVTIETVVQWHVNPSKAMDIYTQSQNVKNFTASVVEPIIRDSVKASSAKYTAEELVQKREDLAGNISTLLIEKLNAVGVVFEGVQIVDFKYSGSFTKAIEDKVVAEQNALGAKNKLSQVQFEAEQRIAEARGEAEAIKIQSTAIQAQGGAGYIELKRIEKWNGAYPTTMLGSTTPIIDLR